jgi:hypothetical protein
LHSTAIVANTPDFLRQIDTSSLDLGDILGVVIGSAALVITDITFYISHTQASQSEQIKTSKDIWASINEKFYRVDNELKTKGVVSEGVFMGVLYPAVKELDYFAYLVLRDEIKDKVVVDYYKESFIECTEGALDIASEIGPTVKRSLKDSNPNIGELAKRWEAKWV